MSYESYNAFATAVKNEIQELDYEQQLGILTIVVSAMNRLKKSPVKTERKRSAAEIVDSLTGIIPCDGPLSIKDIRNERLSARYGV